MDFLLVPFLTFIIGIAIAVGFGFITKHINENKGYEGGFAWGFFLGVIGIIVVACKSDRNYRKSYTPTEIKPTWVCAKCGQVNTTDNDFCGKCSNPRFAKIQKPSSWKCNNCGKDNPSSNAFCVSCGSKYENKIENKWRCPNCKKENDYDNAFCGACGSKKPDVIEEIKVPEVKKVTEYVHEDCLICPYCGVEQKAVRTKCYRCGKELIK